MKTKIITGIENIISNQNADEKEIIYQLKKLLFEVEAQNYPVNDSKKLSELLSDSISDMNGDVDSDEVIKTGFINLDGEIGGFLPGELVVIGGRPSMGKTQFLINLSLHISQTLPVLYFTFDLSEFLLTSRFISSLADIEAYKILQHKLSDEEKEKVTSLEKEIKKHKIFINDSSHTSISAFKIHCLKQIEENDVKVIFVDYLQMMSSNKYRNNRELEISHISRELKTIAKDNNVCVIAASQLSRAVEMRSGSKRPQLSDLRESGAIEQNADKVIFITRPEYYGINQDEEGNSLAGVAELIIAKNRNGRMGAALLKIDSNFTNFKDFDNYTEDFSFSTDRLDEINKPF